MRMWTKSACVVPAWGALLILVAVGMHRSVRPTQANIRIASSTTEVTLTSTLHVALPFGKATSPAARYVVQSGDTLSGIAAALAVRGGWPALYAVNRRAIGPDPNTIHPGTVLVLPGQMAPVRYTVAAGDTLSGIAAALAVRGGWPALYAVNRRAIGPDPNTIHPGTVLMVPRPAAPASPASSPGRRVHPAPPPAPAGSRHRTPPVTVRAPALTGMPPWLRTILLAAGLLIAAAFLGEAVLAIGRRRPAAARAARLRPVYSGRGPGAGKFAGEEARIVLADYDRLVVTHSKADDTVYVLRPPGEDPRAILRVARLVIPEDHYEELARRLGVPASWPMDKRSGG